MDKFTKYFRKDNRKFVYKSLLTFSGFILSNISVVIFDNLKSWEFWLLVAICITFFIIFMNLIFYKYEYYHSLAEQLKSKDRPLFLICSYVAKTRDREKHGKINKFTIFRANVIFEIPEDNENLTITYEFNAMNGLERLSKIYHTSLTAKDSQARVQAQYCFGNDDWSDMELESYYNNDHTVTLWSALKEGIHIQPKEPFSYKFRFTIENGYQISTLQYLIIDPSNYSNDVRSLRIVLCSKDGKLKKQIKVPRLMEYSNGMNIDEKAGTLKFQSYQHASYETYFCIDKIPEAGMNYVMSLVPNDSQVIRDKMLSTLT